MHTRLTTPVGMQRVFIGIPIDKKAQQQINKLLLPIRNSRPDVSWVPENNRHLTIAFMGNRPDFVVENLIGLFDVTYQREVCFQYNMSTLARFPNPTGKIIALVDDPVRPLNNLLQITLELLQANNIEFDRKEFRPHITLGRIRRPEYVKSGFGQCTNIMLNIDKTVLYQSRLTESGPVYSKLKQTRLLPKRFHDGTPGNILPGTPI